MRILHLIHQYPPDNLGGTELYTQTLARYQSQRGDDVSVFVAVESSTTWPEAAREEGVRVYRYPRGPGSPIARFGRTFGNDNLRQAFGQVLIKEYPDIVHIQHLMGLPASVIGLIEERSIPFVITLHDYWYICGNAQLLTNYDETVCDGPQWWINCGHCALARLNLEWIAPGAPLLAPVFAQRNRLLREILSGAEQLIAPSSFVRDLYGSLGVEIQRIRCIPHGIEVPGSSIDRSETVQDKLRVIYVGGLSWQKGVHVLIEAFNRLQSEDVSLTIWGDPSVFSEYSSNLQQMATHPGINFRGTLPHDQLWSALAASDVLVVPSIWYETASLIVQEAFAAGVPVIASRIGALPEKIRDGTDGLLVPPNDTNALYHVLDDLRQSPEMIMRLGSRIEPVRTIDEHGREIQQLYQRCIVA